MWVVSPNHLRTLVWYREGNRSYDLNGFPPAWYRNWFLKSRCARFAEKIMNRKDFFCLGQRTRNGYTFDRIIHI
jgi:hypothetical protein